MPLPPSQPLPRPGFAFASAVYGWSAQFPYVRGEHTRKLALDCRQCLGLVHVQVRLSNTLAATPAAKPQDAFDREDFDATQYINEMFPNGARQRLHMNTQALRALITATI